MQRDNDNQHPTRKADQGNPALEDSGAVADGQKETLLPKQSQPSPETVKRGLIRYFWMASFFTLVMNLLLLVSPLYMLQVYDRVMTSGSQETLLVITFIAIFMLSTYIAADGGRRRVLANAGHYLGSSLDAMTLRLGLGLSNEPPTKMLENIGNLSRVQSFLVNSVIAPLFDIPFAPLFLIVLFMVHPLLGIYSIVGIVILLTLALITDKSSRKTVESAAHRERAAQQLLAHTAQQRAAIVGMGMADRVINRWQKKRHSALHDSLRAVNTTAYLSATTRSVRQILQVGILGLGAYLALQQQVSAGAIVAGSIIMGRALAPIDQIVNIWRQVIQARQSWNELNDYYKKHDQSLASQTPDMVTPMTRPSPTVKLQEFAVGAPGSRKPILPKLSFELPSGSFVALLGPSGSGKTSFMQTLAGAWEPLEGTARLGGRDVHTWQSDDRGQFVGYLPQHVELLTGSVFENIARFSSCTPEAVFDAAKKVGCHEMINAFPEGYDTKIGEGGVFLSAGQRQAVGLARAVFGNPALMLLDEPTAHLDQALSGLLLTYFANIARTPMEQRDATWIVATHDIRIISAADKVMFIQAGKVMLMPKEEYMRKLSEMNKSRAQSVPNAAPAEATKSQAQTSTKAAPTASLLTVPMKRDRGDKSSS